MIERIPVGRWVETVPEAPQDGHFTVIPVVEERIVVTERLMRVEEIRVGRRTTSRTDPFDIGLDRNDVVVERRDATGEWQVVGSSADAVASHSSRRGGA